MITEAASPGAAGTGSTARPPVTFDEIVDQVLRRGLPASTLFGPLDPAGTQASEASRTARRAYRTMARQVHPDVAPAGRRADAAAAFARLTELWFAYQGGAAEAPTSPGAGGWTGAVVVGRARHAYTVGRPHAEGDLAVLHRVDHVELADGRPASDPLLCKIARSADDDDLIAREATALRRIARLGDRRHAAYVPTLVDTARLAGGGSAPARRVNVLARLDGFVTLAEVRTAYPDGLDPRDAVWMWRRLLVAIGYAHRAGVAHGAVLPPHVLIHPAQHGLVLVDWCYSAVPEPADGAVVGPYRPAAGPDDPSRRIPALVAAYADWYPAEVARREPPAAATDIALASRCVSYLLGDEDPARLPAGVPAPIRRFLTGCLPAAPAMRPDDAWRLLGELDDLLGRIYGPRRFRPFAMPARAT
jgi:hypothetical protein